MLPIISADQRLAERHGVKLVLLAPSGLGKTTQLKTLPEESTLFIDLEAGDLAVKDWRSDCIAQRPGRSSAIWWCFSPAPIQPCRLIVSSRRRILTMSASSTAIRHSWRNTTPFSSTASRSCPACV